MGILKKGKDFSPTEQVTSTKLDELVDNASFTNTSETSVAYTGTTGTCLQGGGLEVTSLGQLQIASSGVDNDNILDDTITSNKLSFIEDSVSTTSGKILVADGTTYDAETMSGDATIAAGGALTIGSNKVTPAKTSFLGTVDTTGDSTAHMLIKQADGEYDSKNLTGDVTITQAGVTNVEDDVALGGNPTATTQAASDNSTKIATTAYVTTGIANALTGSGGIFGSLDQTADSVVRIFSKQADGEYDSVTPSGDVAMAQDGAFTIQANSVEGTMLNSNTVDDSTIELSSNTLSIKDNGVTTAKILNSNVTKAKIEDVANMKVLGNTSGSATAPQEVTINDTDTMSDASATTLATSESIKAYVDDNGIKETLLVFNGTTPITIADWDAGANGTQCTLEFEHLSDSAQSDPDTAATDINDANVTLSSNEFTLSEGTYDISVDASITMNTFTSSTPGLAVLGFLRRKSDDEKILVSNILNHSDSASLNMTLHSFIKGRIVVPSSPATNTNVFDLRFVAQASGAALIGQESHSEFEAFNPNHVTVVIRKVKS